MIQVILQESQGGLVCIPVELVFLIRQATTKRDQFPQNIGRELSRCSRNDTAQAWSEWFLQESWGGLVCIQVLLVIPSRHVTS